MGHRNCAIFIQGLIAQKGLECLKALFSWKFENKSPEEEGEEEKTSSCVALMPLLVNVVAAFLYCVIPI